MCAKWSSTQYIQSTDDKLYLTQPWEGTIYSPSDDTKIYINGERYYIYTGNYDVEGYGDDQILHGLIDASGIKSDDYVNIFTCEVMSGLWLVLEKLDKLDGSGSASRFYLKSEDGEAVIGSQAGGENNYFAIVTAHNGDYIGVMSCDEQGIPNPYTSIGGYININQLLNKFDASMPYVDKDTSPEYGDASDTGGYGGGTFDDSSDTIGLPSAPSFGVSSAGFINVYNPSAGALANFGADLFPDFTPIEGGTDVTDAIVNLGKNVTNAINMFTNSRLIDYIIDCHILPVTPEAQTAEQIKVGFKTFEQVAPKISTDYFDVDCGKLNIGEYYGNFIDYGGFTQAKLFLPFVGFVSIQPEYWQSGTLQIIYRFNVIDGSFMCFVLSSSSKSKLTDTVIGQYGGNACVHIPITGLNYSSMISGVVSGASGALSSVASGNVGGVASSAEQVLTSAPSMQSSNSYNATTAFLGVRTPYLLIERSVSHFSRNYANERGIPSQITTKFDSLSGFTRATVEHLDGFDDVTDEELNEIRQLLAEGVIF